MAKDDSGSSNTKEWGDQKVWPYRFEIEGKAVLLKAKYDIWYNHG